VGPVADFEFLDEGAVDSAVVGNKAIMSVDRVFATNWTDRE
jgi:hypothetical protein